jgi:hypothetical protein
LSPNLKNTQTSHTHAAGTTFSVWTDGQTDMRNIVATVGNSSNASRNVRGAEKGHQCKLKCDGVGRCVRIADSVVRVKL